MILLKWSKPSQLYSKDLPVLGCVLKNDKRHENHDFLLQRLSISDKEF